MDTNIIVGSESALKVRAVRAAFAAAGVDIGLVTGVSVESGVSSQPVGAEEMQVGARTRARNARDARPGADYYIGIENGLVCQNCNWYDPTCVFILESHGLESIAFGPFFPIPKWTVERTLKLRSELGEIVKELAGGGEKDPMKYFSQGTIPREELLALAVRCALAPLMNPQRYKEH